MSSQGKLTVPDSGARVPTAQEEMSVPQTPTEIITDDEEEPEVRALSYGVSSTTIVYGLPEEEKYNMLRAYRTRYHSDMTNDWRKRPYSSRHDAPPSLMTYNLCCQYFKNIQALDVSEHTDSISGESDDMPPLEPIAPSEPSTPIADLTVEAEPTVGAPSAPVAGNTGDAKPAMDIPTLKSPWNEYGDGSRRGTTDGEGVERAWSALDYNNRWAGTTASVVDTFMPASFFLEGAGLSFGENTPFIERAWAASLAFMACALCSAGAAMGSTAFSSVAKLTHSKIPWGTS
ncbi:hypothetical protein B0H13DRAFT_1916202 [Mycena leptocephala]|nr:hypothetical protein B0H13DRAFT_1916202 [Mycena leptocephala]